MEVILGRMRALTVIALQPSASVFLIFPLFSLPVFIPMIGGMADNALGSFRIGWVGLSSFVGWAE